MKNRWQLLLLVAAVLVCAGLAQTQPGHAVLRDAGLYETPAAYTELTFSAPGTLPDAVAKPNASVTVAFGIHNVSNDSRNYNWSIVLVHSGKSQVKASGTVLTMAQGRSSVSKSVPAACSSGRVQVVVRLASPAESISFWVACPTATVKKQVKP
jgi:hypothetical protein